MHKNATFHPKVWCCFVLHISYTSSPNSSVFMHKNVTFRLWGALGQLWKPLAELRETLGEPLGGSGRMWEYTKT